MNSELSKRSVGEKSGTRDEFSGRVSSASFGQDKQRGAQTQRQSRLECCGRRHLEAEPIMATKKRAVQTYGPFDDAMLLASDAEIYYELIDFRMVAAHADGLAGFDDIDNDSEEQKMLFRGTLVLEDIEILNPGVKRTLEKQYGVDLGAENLEAQYVRLLVQGRLASYSCKCEPNVTRLAEYPYVRVS